MTHNPVGWFEIYVQDMDRAKRFYETMLGVTLTKLNDSQPLMWAFPQSFTQYGAAGALAYMEGMPSGGNSTLVYFACDDCAVEAARIPAAGGSVFREKFSIGQYGFIALAIDTEGNMFGLHSMK